MWRKLLLSVCAVLLAGCATYYKEPKSDAPRALLSAKQKECIFGCKAGVFIRAVNGIEMSTNWKTNNYYVEPGPNAILLAVVDVGLFGVCVMELNAVAGESYVISHVIEGDKFVVTANDSGGSAQGTCTAKMGAQPAGPAYVPIIVPVGK